MIIIWIRTDVMSGGFSSLILVCTSQFVTFVQWLRSRLATAHRASATSLQGGGRLLRTGSHIKGFDTEVIVSAAE